MSSLRAEKPLQVMEFQEKEEEKGNHTGELFRKTPNKKVVYYLDYRSKESILQAKKFLC